MHVNAGRVGDDFRAACFDRAVWTFGTTVEADMDSAEAGLGPKAKENRKAQVRQRVLNQYLGGGDVVGQFRDPAAMMGKRRG